MSGAEVAASAPLNDLPPDQLRLASAADGSVGVQPGRAGWRYLSFQVIAVDARGFEVGDREDEQALVILAGEGLTLELGRDAVELPGRGSVFDDLPSAVYLPAGTRGTIRPVSSSCRVAIASAPVSGRHGISRDPIVIGRGDVQVEVRGAGNATRQINHIITPDFPADRLELVEVLTPSGNWSSWPPHKHDIDDMPREAVLEEVYYYAFRRAEAWGIQRLYRRDGSRDVIWTVRDGDLVLVTDGYHPFVATQGDDAYYLNALAGDRRTMACSFDPDLDWVRDAWAEMDPDPRVPLVPASG